MADKDKHTKKRVSKACDCCRKSKTKCDGQRPCTRCLQDGKICTYMTKKKAGQVYPAAYVDLLETRVSVLVQTLTQLLDKSREGPSSIYEFCADSDLVNEEGDWDINQVISRLLPADRLQNLAESSQSYSLQDITDVASSPSSTTSTSQQYNSAQHQSRSPSPRAMHSNQQHQHHHHHAHGHTSLSKARRNSDNHVHKLPTTRSSNSSSSSSASSVHSRFSIPTTSPSTSYSESPLSTSLDIFKQPRATTTLDSVLSGPEEGAELELESVNFSDTNTGSTLMSPVYSIDECEQNNNQCGKLSTVQSLDSAFQDLFPVAGANAVSGSTNPFMNGSVDQKPALGLNGAVFGFNDWDMDETIVKKEPITLDPFEF